MSSPLSLLLSVLLPQRRSDPPQMPEPSPVAKVRHPQIEPYGSAHRPSVVERMAIRARAEHRRTAYD